MKLDYSQKMRILAYIPELQALYALISINESPI